MMILIYLLAGGLAVLVVALLAGSVSQIEDWNRDLSQNWASTSATAQDERLQNVVSDKSRAELVLVVREAAKSLGNWQWADETAGENGQVEEIHLVRTTKLMRFKDDIRVKLTEQGSGKIEISAESQSRVGKGDLGQNPRNLRELFSAIRVRL